MKKFGIMIIALSLLIVGMAMADPGIPQIPEVQGLKTTTTVIAVGNFNADSSIDWTISTGSNLNEIVGDLDGTVYQSVYTEDTQNSDIGFLTYDKDLDFSSSNKKTGQYNTKAVKQITYVGVDASSVMTTDYMMVDGAGTPAPFSDVIICPFAGGTDYPQFCNKVETGSSMTLKIANLNTNMGERHVMVSADPGVEIYNNVGVGAYAADVPSKGSASAFIRGSIREGGRSMDPFAEDADALFERIVFSDSTAISGDITTFAKAMSYSSGMV